MGVKVFVIGKNEAERKDHGASKETQNQAGMDRRVEIELEKMKILLKL